MVMDQECMCQICQQPVAGQHWERWQPCGDALHRSCASRQRRAEDVCACCGIRGKPNPDQRCDVGASDSARGRYRCELCLLCKAALFDRLVSELVPLEEEGDPVWRPGSQPVWCFLLQLHRVRQAWEQFRRFYQGPAPGGRLESVHAARADLGCCAVVKPDPIAACSSWFQVPPWKDRLRDKVESSIVSQPQDISLCWSIERRFLKSQAEGVEVAPSRRGAVRRRVQRRARSRARQRAQEAIASRRNREARSASQGSRVGEEAEESRRSGQEPTAESHEEAAGGSSHAALTLLQDVPEPQQEADEARGTGDEIGGDAAPAHAPGRVEEIGAVQEEAHQAPAPAPDPDNRADREELYREIDEATDSDPDYPEPEGFDGGAIVDDEQSIARSTINRRSVDMEGSDYDEDTASDASDTSHGYLRNADEQEEDGEEHESERVDTTGSSAETTSRTASSRGHAFGFYSGTNAGNMWTGTWSSLCSRVREYLPHWRGSIQAVRNRMHQRNRPVEDIPPEAPQQDQLPPTSPQPEPHVSDAAPPELDYGLMVRPETRRVRRRMSL